MKTYTKDPNAVLEYKWDWKDADSPWLADGETITTSQMIATSVTLDSSSNTTTTATAWLSGGTVDTEAFVTNRITTNQGRTDDRTIRLLIRQR